MKKEIELLNRKRMIITGLCIYIILLGLESPYLWYYYEYGECGLAISALIISLIAAVFCAILLSSAVVVFDNSDKIYQVLLVCAFAALLYAATDASIEDPNLPSVELSDAELAQLRADIIPAEDKAFRSIVIDMERKISEDYYSALTHNEPIDDIVIIHQLHHQAAENCGLNTLCDCGFVTKVR